MLSLACFLALFVPALTVPIDGSTIVPGQFLITFKQDIGLSNLPQFVNTMGGYQGQGKQGVKKMWSGSTFKGCTGAFNDSIIQKMKGDPRVQNVEPLNVYNTQASQVVTQSNPPWGLAAISHRKPGATTYDYVASTRKDLWAYVVDTGVYTDHAEFEGRAFPGYNAVPNTAMTDRMGHGTHCAGIIASKTYGVMKNANIMAVKVFDNGGSTTDIVMDGFLWAVSNITLTPGRLGNAVISLSLGGGKSDAFNLAVSNAVAAGIPVIVAAGNANSDASLFSPASAPGAVAVGAVNSNNVRAPFSNFGSILDLFAPGVYITSLGITSNTATAIMSGTSMACPHVAGLTLYFMSTRSFFTTVANIVTSLLRISVKGLITDPGLNSPNFLAYNGVA